jgi:serine/threonine protein kinase
VTEQTRTIGRYELVGEIGHGGMATVYLARQLELGRSVALKELAAVGVRDPALADRFVRESRLAGSLSHPNVVHVYDYFEAEGTPYIAMEYLERGSLRPYVGGLTLPQVAGVLEGLLAGLAHAAARAVVHRDLKPENVLVLGGAWHLADFGISRYAEATTAADTRKFALSPPYAAPERWRNERASGATDIYSLGVMAYEMLAGDRPFPGPRVEEFREQHLHADPPPLEGMPALVAALVEECLYKAPGARPTPANVARRLDAAASEPQSAGVARLREANRQEVSRRAESARQASAAQTVEEARRDLAQSAGKALTRIGDALRDAILAAAPSTTHEQGGGGWALRLNHASLSLSTITRTAQNPWQWDAPTFDVICHAELNLRIPEDRYQYKGRSHSLWFCDAQAEGEYAWYETAFMVSALIPRRGRQNPFALAPGEESAKALWMGMAEYQMAWPFTRLVLGELDDFINRWAGWFADAAGGRLTHPSTMPERDASGSFRRS